MKRLLIYAAKKGGVGKTFAAIVFTELAREAGRSVSAWDLDGETGSLALHFGSGSATESADIDDIRNASSSARWLDAIYGDADDVVLDVPGGALTDLLRVYDAGPAALIREAREAGREIILVSVINHMMDGTATAQEAVEIFDSHVHHVVLKNLFWADANEFVVFDGLSDADKARALGITGVTRKMVVKAGGEIVSLPALNRVAVALVDVRRQSARMTYHDASRAADVLGRRPAGNIRYWLDGVVAAWRGSWLDVNADVPLSAASPNGMVAMKGEVSVAS